MARTIRNHKREHHHPKGGDNETAIALLNDAKGHVATAYGQIDDAILILSGAPPDPPPDGDVIEVMPGDDLRAILDDAPEGATLSLDPACTFDVNGLKFTKSVTLVSSAHLEVGRVSPALVGPQLYGDVTFAASHITWRGLRLEGRGNTMVTAGPFTTL